MTRWISIAVSAAVLWLGAAAAQQSQQTQKKAAPAKKTSTPAARKSAPAKKSAPASVAAKRTTAPSRTGTAARTGTANRTAAARKGAPKKPAATWRNRQMSPSPDRYREIQDALASRGYLRPEEATGAWNQASIEALKRFQAEQNLESNGKINSLSLIALGLGPKREAVPAMPVPAVPPAAPEVPAPAR